ncbi:laminin subunit beta-3 isoform 2-T6 [Spinachia spinachia]
MRILLLLTAIAAASQAQTDCSQGACYPSSNDLLLGRSQLLHASSTCGLMGAEIYCTPYQQRKMECCPCDSRNSNSKQAHTVRDALPTSGPNRWWQSVKEVSPVTLQLNLDNLFQLDNLVLNFKGPRPSAFVIERTLDNGRSWQPDLYLATDCEGTFPGIPTTAPQRLDDPYCSTLPPTGANPYQDHQIQFSPLRQYANVPATKSQIIEDASALTGLRVRFTKLGDVPRPPGRAFSRFYAVREMRVMGSCMCHGHANQCLPDTSNNLPADTVQVHPRCDCQHNTAGVNCERCADLFQDLPWRPAEESNPHTCKRCECNNHAKRCHFDPARYEASGRRSGGVCEGCMHNTTGPKCDQCAQGFQPNPRSQINRSNACIQCSCSPDGSMSDACDPISGQCSCRSYFQGLKCEVCSQGYWKPPFTGCCQTCGCDSTRSYGDTCDQVTGQCQCRPGFGGQKCTECAENTYGDPLIGCKLCRCDAEGTLSEICDKRTGACLCRPGVNGTRCDLCSRGRCDSFPGCETCPSCFFTLDAQREKLSSALEKLSLRLPSRPIDGDLGNFTPRIRALEVSLTLIQNSISLPPSAAVQIDDALSKLNMLRDQVDKINNDLSPLERAPGLDSELERLQALLYSLTLEYKAKMDGKDNSVGKNDTGALSAIRNAYNESTDAAKRVNSTKKLLKESADIREATMDLQNKVQPSNTGDLQKLNQNMASQPNLTPVAKQVCGSVRSEPCTPLQCAGGDLCPPDGTPPCKKGQVCVGALPLSKRADADAKNVKDRVDKLTGKITDAVQKLQQTQETTNLVRKSAEKLSNKMKQARDELEDDLKETRDVVNNLKDFLSDPFSNLTSIQEVSDWILNTKLPLNLAELMRKLKQLQDLAASLPDSSSVLKEAEPQLEAAQKLLQEAQDARDMVLGGKADVDGLLDGFASVEGSLSDLEDRLQNTMDDINNLNLTKVNDQLSPAEMAVDNAEKLIKPLKPQLDELKDLLQTAAPLAQNLEENAESAEDKAAAANKDLLTLEEQLGRLKDQVPATGSGGSELGDRVTKLREEAGALANSTNNMMTALQGKADSLRGLQDEIRQKSTTLEGLDVKLKELLDQLRQKAKDFSTCQG